MKMSGAAQRLIIYIGESDEWEGEPLYVALVKKFREMGIAGVTVVRGIMGYGANNRIHKAKLLTLSEDMPIRIEVVDKPEYIQQILPVLDEMVVDGLIAISNVEVVRYSQDPKKSAHFAMGE
jgi:PII-like signaling protein